MRPLTLRTSPRDYSAFNQIKYVLVFNTRLLLGKRKKNSKIFSLYAFTTEQGWISAKIANVVEYVLALISNDPSLKLFTLNQVIDEVIFVNNPMFLSLVYLVKAI